MLIQPSLEYRYAATFAHAGLCSDLVHHAILLIHAHNSHTRYRARASLEWLPTSVLTAGSSGRSRGSGHAVC